MEEVDPTLPRGLRGEVLHPESVIQGLPRPPDRRNHQGARPELRRNGGAGRGNEPEGFVADDQVVVALGGRPEEPFEEFPVGPTEADPEGADEEAVAAGHVVDRRSGNLPRMDRTGTRGRIAIACICAGISEPMTISMRTEPSSAVRPSSSIVCRGPPGTERTNTTYYLPTTSAAQGRVQRQSSRPSPARLPPPRDLDRLAREADDQDPGNR